MRKMIWGKKRTQIICVLLSLMLLSACGSGSAEGNRIEIRRDGSVRAVSYADFPADRYDLPSLEKEAGEAVDVYNDAAGEKRIRLKDVSGGGGNARTVLDYEDCADYTAFNGCFLYTGNIDEALGTGAAEGYIPLRAADGSGSSTLGSLLQQLSAEEIASYTVVVTEETMYVQHYGTPVYFSPNCNAEPDGTIDAHPDPESEMGRACIIYRVK